MTVPAQPRVTARALIFANGDSSDGVMVRRALSASSDAWVIAADGGVRHARAFGFPPHLVIGDMDSAAPGDIAWAQERGAHIRRYPTAKDETDLELALLAAAEQGAGWVRVIAAIGDRLDQTLSGVYLLGLPALAGADVRLVAGRQETWLADVGETIIDGAPGDTVSLIPLAGDVIGITTDGLEYPLRGEPLHFGPARGVSNVLLGVQGRVQVTAGRLLIVHTSGRA
jgi:thiamine pyrophosphokinase